MKRIRVAQIGCGHWGANLMRNLSQVPELELVAACDLDSDRLTQTQRQYRSVAVTRNYEEILANPQVDAVLLATFPLSTHYEFARLALEHGKHVLVEKPLATSTAEASRLLDLAERRRRVLMVDHTFLYTGAVRHMKELLDAGEVGELLSFDSIRISFRLIPGDTNVLWDLGPHDFSVMDYLCGTDVMSLSAAGVRHLSGLGEDTAYLRVSFQSGLTAHLHLSSLAATKVRMTRVGGTRKTMLFDDTTPQKVKVCDRNARIQYDPEQRTYQLADGEWIVPALDQTEALALVVREFAGSILEDRAPLTDGRSGYRIVRLLEAAQRSIEQNGREVRLCDTAEQRARRSFSIS